MPRFLPLTSAILALVVAAPVAAADVQLPTETMSAEDAAVIDQAMASLLEKYPDIPAWYVGVWDQERGAYQQAYGLADVANGRAASVEDTFRIGSVSKTFMATVMLQLVDEGLIGLDSTVADADPELAERFPAYADITVEQLLNMTSGIEDYMNVPDAAVATLVTAPDTVWEPEQLIGYGVDAGVSPPGEFGYSTTNYLVMQLIAETLTGKSIQDLIRERVTEPLGMTETVLPPNEDTTLPEPFARGYLRQACVDELVDDGAQPVPAGTDTTEWNASYGQSGGGMHSTIADLGIWAASMSGNALLSEGLAEARIAPLQEGQPYGLGMLLFANEFGHEGEAIGWEGWVGHDPDSGLSVVVFTNSCSDIGAVIEAVAAVDPVFATLTAAPATGE